MQCAFAPKTEFSRVLKSRVQEYLKTQDDRPLRRAYALKFTIIAAWYLASYVGLVFYAQTLLQALALSLSLGLAMAGIGFSIMHGANHGALPFSRPVSRALGWSIDFLGASSYVWRFKHNVAHHTYTNVDGKDGDLEAGSVARLSPHQAWHPMHRFQFIYLWPLYSLSTVNWILVSDWFSIRRCRNKFTSFPAPRGTELVLLWAGKLTSFSMWFVIPLLVRPWPQAIFFSLLTMMILGFVLAVVFQLAHVVELLEFTSVDDSGKLDRDWMTHQLMTTANFATQDRFLGWYLGGLNFQIEHHLFAGVADLHYPAISKIVRATCEEFGLPYHSHPTFLGALASHQKMLRQLGQPPESAAVVAQAA
ncbi:MAG: acyl-CoA desaturase [Myxococcota bacterium]